TPGEILDSFHAFGADNGMLNFLTNDFTPSATSARDEVEPWNQTLTWAVAKNTTYKTARDQLVAYGLINWRCEGHLFRVFNDSAEGYVSEWGGMQRDLTDGDNPVTLMLGRECIDGPQQFSRRNLADNAWVLGDNGAAWLRTNPNAFIRRGSRVKTISQGGVDNEGSA